MVYGLLGSPDLLLSYPTTTLASHLGIILHTNNNPYLHLQHLSTPSTDTDTDTDADTPSTDTDTDTDTDADTPPTDTDTSTTDTDTGTDIRHHPLINLPP